MDIKNKMIVDCIDIRLSQIRKRRSELVELIQPYQKEMDDLYEEAVVLDKKRRKLIEKLEV